MPVAAYEAAQVAIRVLQEGAQDHGGQGITRDVASEQQVPPHATGGAASWVCEAPSLGVCVWWF